jgi:hypothetical protein
MSSEVAQKLSAKGVERSALDAINAWSKHREPRCDFAGGLVGESEDADPLRIERAPLNQEPNPLDQAESLAGARARQNEHRIGWSFDGLALRRGWDVRRG